MVDLNRPSRRSFGDGIDRAAMCKIGAAAAETIAVGLNRSGIDETQADIACKCAVKGGYGTGCRIGKAQPAVAGET